MNGNIKMRIRGILYTGKTVYECLCKAVREPINIHARMVDVVKKIEKKPTTKMEDNNGIY